MNKKKKRRSRGRFAVVVSAVGIAIVVTSHGGFASPPPPSQPPSEQQAPNMVPETPRPTSSAFSLQVSFDPPEVQHEILPGQTIRAEFRVTNPGTAPFGVAVRSATPIPGNDGELKLEDLPDPRFPDIGLSPARFDAAPGSTTVVEVQVTAPDDLAPGGYLLGFLVAPTHTAPGVTVVNRVGALVTLRVPGPVQSRMSAYFHGLGDRVPFLGHVQLAPSGSATLRVSDDSPSGMFAFHEITADVTGLGLGRAVIDGHTEGLDNNIRHRSQIYLPGKWIDYPVEWRVTPSGFGLTRLTAVVTYHTDIDKMQTLSVTQQVWLVSPWCLLLLVAWPALMLFGFSQRARRLTGKGRRGPVGRWGRAGRVAGVASVSLLVVATASFAHLPLFAGAALLGPCAGAGAVLRPRSDLPPGTAGQRLRVVALMLTALAVLAGTVSVANVAAGGSLALAFALFAAVGVWLLVLRVLLRRWENQTGATRSTQVPWWGRRLRPGAEEDAAA